MPIEKIKNNIPIKILIFSIVGCFLVNIIIYLWLLDYHNGWRETTAKVVEITKTKKYNLGRSGYLIFIKLKINSDLYNFNNSNVVDEYFSLNSTERSNFFENTNTNKIIPVWINPFYNYEIEIIKPTKPFFTKYLLLIFYVFGSIFFAIGALIFCERIKK